MNDVYVIGVGMLRFNKYPDKTVRGMGVEAVDLALLDAGLKKDDIQAAYVSNTFWGMYSNQHSIRGEIILRASTESQSSTARTPVRAPRRPCISDIRPSGPACAM